MSQPASSSVPQPAVLHALAWPGLLAGAPRSMEESIAALLGLGISVSAWLATSQPKSRCAALERFRERGIPWVHREAYTAVDPLAVADLARRLRALRKASPNGAVLHSHGERALLWGSAAARAARVPHVHSHHGFGYEFMEGRKADVARRLMDSVGAVITVDKSHHLGLSNEHEVTNCLDGDAFASSSTSLSVDGLKKRYGLRPEQLCVLFLGRLCVEKGADYLAVVQSELQKRSGSAKLVVAGSGDLAPGVEAMTDVLFLGQRDAPAELLRMADVLILPSRTENLPMVALEAAAMGVPAVGFAVGGMAASDLVQTVPSGEVPTLVKLALEVCRNANARKGALDVASLALAGQHSPSLQAEALVGVYRDLV